MQINRDDFEGSQGKQHQRADSHKTRAATKAENQPSRAVSGPETCDSELLYIFKPGYRLSACNRLGAVEVAESPGAQRDDCEKINACDQKRNDIDSCIFLKVSAARIKPRSKCKSSYQEDKHRERWVDEDGVPTCAVIA